MDSQRRSSFGGRSSTTAVPKSPLSGPIPVSSEKEYVPLMALNPYQSQWTIKVKVAKLYDLRRFTSKREPQEESAVFTVLLIDDQATQIEGTFWRDAAEYFHERLQEGKVYYFSNFSVKTANKKYASVDFEYCVNFDARTRVEEAMDQDTTKMQAKLEIIEFTELPKFIDRSTLVTVLGVVTNVAASGKVKRRADSSELVRRDVTLVDKSLKTVNLTLWSSLAETIGSELEKIYSVDPPTALIKNVRISSFNGISLASVNRTEVEINPEMAEAQELHDWYELVGKTEILTPLSEGLPNARGASLTEEPKFLKEVDVDQVPGLDDKPTYSTVHCTIVYINPEQSMYYLANKKNNRKVVEQEGQYYCEFDGQLYDSAELRFLFSMKVADFTKECWVNVFNEQAEEIMGMTATALDEIRNEKPSQYKTQLTKCQFKPVVLRIMSKAREMPSSGEVALRHNVVAVKPMSFREETQKLLKDIEAYASVHCNGEGLTQAEEIAA